MLREYHNLIGKMSEVQSYQLVVDTDEKGRREKRVMVFPPDKPINFYAIMDAVKAKNRGENQERN